MSVDQRILALLGWRKNGLPNIADSGDRGSIRLSTHVYEALGVTRDSDLAPQSVGSAFEAAVRSFLADRVAERDSDAGYQVGTEQIVHFTQYAHLRRMQDLLDELDPEGVIRAEFGADYVIKPDITVGLPGRDELPFLHAAVSCKWTIRSDRVQNIRHEAIVLTRHRRGRQPHIVAVTAEPTPSRLASIARGTGEIDCVYHVALAELRAAAESVGTHAQIDTLDELVLQDRLRPLEVLPEVLTLY